MPESRATSTYARSRIVSTWARIVRVGVIQASEATISAMISTVSVVLIVEAITTSTARAGIGNSVSASPPMIVSVVPPK